MVMVIQALIIPLLFLFLSAGSWADSEAPICLMSELPAEPKPTIMDVYPFNFFTKSWMASAEMKSHFAEQKKLFRDLNAERLPTKSSPNTEITLASVGDLMRLPSKQDFVDPRVKDFLTKFDLLVGNLETLITPTQPVPPDSLFLMNSDSSLLTNFAESAASNAFSALSLANNHIYDFNDQAIMDTIRAVQSMGIKPSGFRLTETDKAYTVLARDDITIGYYAISTLMNNTEAMAQSQLLFNPMLEGYDSTPFRARNPDVCNLDYGNIERIIQQMEADHIDLKVLSIHWGFEHEMYPRPEQMQIARQLMALGFDVIFGSHTHTPQPAEICFLNNYDPQRQVNCRFNTDDGKPRKAVVFYSLGNFNSYSNVFWQQVGTIAGLTVRKSDNTVDWHSPEFTFTYDHTYLPPNGPQFMSFLDSQGIACPFEHCGNLVELQQDYPARHLTGANLSLKEQIIWGLQSLADTVYSFVTWTWGTAKP